MRRIIYVFMVYLIGCSVIPYKSGDMSEASRVPAKVYGENDQPMAVVPLDQRLTFEAFRAMLISQRIKSIEEALPALVQRYPEYFKFHTLMYGSLSLHGSSFDEPRAFVFGPEARFILTFNGGVHQKGGLAFETVEYSTYSRSFLFREVVFKTKGFDMSELDLKPNEIAFQNAQLVISHPNPEKCLRCHGQTASPIWMTYFLWPGAYGSDDDDLYLSFDKAFWGGNEQDFFKAADRPHSQARFIVLKEGSPDKEVEGYIRYLQKKPSHPRYKWLPAHIVDQSYLRFANGEAFANLDLSDQMQVERERVKARYSWPSRPNLFLQEALQRLNQDRFIARLERAGLKGAFRSPAWRDFFKGIQNIQEKDSIPSLARLVQGALSQFKFRRGPPTLVQIEDSISKNLRDEIEMQRERIYRHEKFFGSNALKWFDLSPSPYHRFYEWITDPVRFYSSLLGIDQPTEKDRIAFNMETDNQIFLTALAFLLEDRGIDLHQYNMNLRGMSLSFHSNGLGRVEKFLGIGAGDGDGGRAYD